MEKVKILSFLSRIQLNHLALIAEIHYTTNKNIVEMKKKEEEIWEVKNSVLEVNLCDKLISVVGSISLKCRIKLGKESWPIKWLSLIWYENLSGHIHISPLAEDKNYIRWGKQLQGLSFIWSRNIQRVHPHFTICNRIVVA